MAKTVNTARVKRCGRCKAVWVCRVCARRTCEHFCRGKKHGLDGSKIATCGKCVDRSAFAAFAPLVGQAVLDDDGGE